MSGNQLRYSDEQDYNQLAQSLVKGKGYVNAKGQPTAYRPPGWPFVLSVIYKFSSQPLAAKIFNAIALACTAWFLSILVSKNTLEGRAFAPILVLFYPVGLYTATTLYPQTLGTLLLVSILILLNTSKLSAIHSIFAGILLGLLLLSIPAFLLVIPLIFAGFFIVNRTRSISFVIRHSVILLICAAVIVIPWTIRNAFVLKGFVPVSTNSGGVFLLGNSENTTPNSGVNVDISRYQTEGMDEVELDKHFKQSAFAWIRNNPCAAIKLYLLKVLNYFNFRNELATRGEATSLRDVISFCSYYPLLLIAIIRITSYRKKYPMLPIETMLYLIYFGNAFTSAIFFTRIRFRVPFDALLITIVAAFFGFLLRSIGSNTSETSASSSNFGNCNVG
jgi:4-amino-4-deoxy-L-arabinose transferase-like glycosyltransferase